MAWKSISRVQDQSAGRSHVLFLLLLLHLFHAKLCSDFVTCFDEVVPVRRRLGKAPADPRDSETLRIKRVLNFLSVEEVYML